MRSHCGVLRRLSLRSCSHEANFVRTKRLSFAWSDFRSPSAEAVAVPPCGDRAKGAWPRPLHSPALRQPSPPLRGAFARSRFLTDRRRFAPAQRCLSPHPCGSPWNPSLGQRVGMSPQHPRCDSNAFSCFIFAVCFVGAPFMATRVIALILARPGRPDGRWLRFRCVQYWRAPVNRACRCEPESNARAP